jgi:DNA-directed RNA polymerase subunit M/transcription elongation factor TFIIS
MIPDLELMGEAIPVPAYTEQCPKCDNDKLGMMITLRLQFCPDCSTWLRYAKGSRTKAEHVD